MKRITLVLGLVAVMMLGAAAPASAAIHPLMVGWVCGNATGDPPGQTPGMNHSDQSTLRALQATGILTFTQSGPVIDLTKPEAKFSSFNPITETGTPSNQGALNCANGQ
ncbi:MAG TPA: hypothetical protein VI814_07955 [Candidatus Limnocylindria bacterium]